VEADVAAGLWELPIYDLADVHSQANPLAAGTRPRLAFARSTSCTWPLHLSWSVRIRDPGRPAGKTGKSRRPARDHAPGARQAAMIGGSLCRDTGPGPGERAFLRG